MAFNWVTNKTSKDIVAKVPPYMQNANYSPMGKGKNQTVFVGTVGYKDMQDTSTH